MSDAMSDRAMSGQIQQESLFVKSGLHAYFFRRTAEGTIFTSPPNWIFGRGREYRVSDAQEAELAARLGRAYVVCLIGLALGLIPAVAVMRWLDGQPLVAYAAAVSIASVPLLLCIIPMRRAIRSVLADASSTPTSRTQSFKSTWRFSLALHNQFPTGMLVALLVMVLGALVMPIIQATAALSTGELSKTVIPLVQIIVFSALLVLDVLLLRARRAAQRAG